MFNSNEFDVAKRLTWRKLERVDSPLIVEGFSERKCNIDRDTCNNMEEYKSKINYEDMILRTIAKNNKKDETNTILKGKNKNFIEFPFSN